MRTKPILVAVLVSLATVRPAFSQPTHVSYQGELIENGLGHSGPAHFKFAILSGSLTLWSNDGTSLSGSEPSSAVAINVDDGIFSIRLGDTSLTGMSQALSADVLGGSTDAVLRVWVSTDGGVIFEQLSDQLFSSSAFALNSETAQRALGNFTASGVIHSIVGGFQFPDGTVQTTAASDCLDLHMDVVATEAIAGAGNKLEARVAVSVNSAGGPVTGLTLADFTARAIQVAPGGCDVTLIGMSAPFLGTYVLDIVPLTSSPTCVWLQGKYVIAVRATTPLGQVVGVALLEVDIP